MKRQLPKPLVVAHRERLLRESLDALVQLYGCGAWKLWAVPREFFVGLLAAGYAEHTVKGMLSLSEDYPEGKWPDRWNETVLLAQEAGLVWVSPEPEPESLSNTVWRVVPGVTDASHPDGWSGLPHTSISEGYEEWHTEVMDAHEEARQISLMYAKRRPGYQRDDPLPVGLYACEMTTPQNALRGKGVNYRLVAVVSNGLATFPGTAAVEPDSESLLQDALQAAKAKFLARTADSTIPEDFRASVWDTAQACAIGALAERDVVELQAEVERLREALMAVRDQNWSHGRTIETEVYDLVVQALGA